MAMILTKEQRVKTVQLCYQNNQNGAAAARSSSAEFNIPQVHLESVSIEKSYELQDSLLHTRVRYQW